MKRVDWQKIFWVADDYKKSKEKAFSVIRNYITWEPKTILDIGCGPAITSGLLQKEYGSNLYLLEGAKGSNQNGTRETRFGSVDSMCFYSSVNWLKDYWDDRDLDYTFLDANDLNISEDLKFDLIMSLESCGFNYPLDTYKNIYFDNSLPQTYFIFDLRKSRNQGDIEYNIIEKIGYNIKLDMVVLDINRDLRRDRLWHLIKYGEFI